MSRGASHVRMADKVPPWCLLWSKNVSRTHYLDGQAAASAFPRGRKIKAVRQAAPRQAAQPLMQRTRAPRNECGPDDYSSEGRAHTS